MKMSLEAKEEGLSIRPVVAPRPIGLLFGLREVKILFLALIRLKN